MVFLPIVATVAVVSFFLHFIWEMVQCPLFYVHGNLAPTAPAMLVATAGDVFLTVSVYIVIAFTSKKSNWLSNRWTSRQWLTVETAAVLLSVAVEKIGLYLNRWSYKAITPTLPVVEVSLVPILQLMILFPATFALTGYLFRHGVIGSKIDQPFRGKR